MARKARRNPDGVPGDWFIDDRCIGCGASISIAPDLIGQAGDGRRFAFRRQAAGTDDVYLAQLAAEVCPTGSIGTESRLRWTRHHPLEVTEDVWRCGANAQDAAGGHSYLVRRTTGNLLIDGPRYAPRLVRELTRLGGIAHVLLTHRDDVGDAQRYAAEFGADVLIHENDATPPRSLPGC